MIKRLKEWLFPNSFTAGAEFAADNTEKEVERCIEYARYFGDYGDFERGMEYNLQRRRRV